MLIKSVFREQNLLPETLGTEEWSHIWTGRKENLRVDIRKSNS